MDLQSIIVLIIIGAIAGWLAGQIMSGGGFGLIGDIIVGIIGAFIGSWLWGVLASAGHRPVVADGDYQRDHRRLHPAVHDPPGETGLTRLRPVRAFRMAV